MIQIVSSQEGVVFGRQNLIAAHSGSSYIYRDDLECVVVSGVQSTYVNKFYYERVALGNGLPNTSESLLWQHFINLYQQWLIERRAMSSATKMIVCPAYQKIIAMGPQVVPLVLRKLKDEGSDPDHWFWALEMLTGADPVPVESYGKTLEMAKAWLKWAEDQEGKVTSSKAFSPAGKLAFMS